MYRVMLIDDEANARSLMRATIDWESLGMEVVGEAASGIEAINIIDDIRPDLAFVDIAMPFMNGIEFTEVATNRYPDLVIIIMTAFDEFEYARKCIRLPVFDYMLKPIVRNEVMDALRRALVKLDEISERKAREEESPSLDDNDSTTELIKKYIRDNYTNQDINLTSVAQEFGFSSSYLSRKFKLETGKNFVEYITECRMEHAMKLAQDGVKMYAAASEVGIPDPNYFGRCFKKYTGKGYSEFMSGL